MFNNIPINGWPQLKALEGVDSLPASIDSRITAIEDWIEEVAPTDQADTRTAAEPVKKTTRKKVVKDAQ